MLRRFLTSRDGGAAIMFALSIVPITLGVGAAIDYSRATAVQGALQARVDEAALTIASSRIEGEARILRTARKALNNAPVPFEAVARITLATLDARGEEVKVEASAAMPTTFMRITGIADLTVNARASARRAGNGNVEIALVLDNTWSMSERDSSGIAKIDALKKSSADLVNQVKPSTATTNPNTTIKFALVPYANYVNVGLGNRAKSWLSVPADHSKNECWDTCEAWGAPKTCSGTSDGVPITYDCTPCTKTARTCSTRSYTWYGCVGSRTLGRLRLDDSQPMTPYPGIMSPYKNCLNEVTPLTDDKSKILSALQGMTINADWFKPSTYIPAGMIWGLNVLSPSEPFSEARGYGSGSNGARKILVLMTDGENTLAVNQMDGTHYDTWGNQSENDATNADTSAICSTVKAKGIEVFTVAFAVKSTSAKSLLEGCATDSAHYFDAQNAAALASAFERIGQAVSGIVRLSR